MVRNWPANALIGSKCDVFFEKLKHREFRNSLVSPGESRKTGPSPFRDDTQGEKTEVKLTGAQIVWKVLEREGVDTVFGYPGGCVLPMYDALQHTPSIH